MPRSIVIPEVAYPNIGEAIDCLCKAFGSTVRIQIGITAPKWSSWLSTQS